ncbi:hypothetical protein ACFXO9_21730 [Nocardia tengchongensis]|uniref:hypothetical protein n=1 Tax=Nocardia tengchongensis TaxID=2055889 RepID=UPI003684E90C
MATLYDLQETGNGNPSEFKFDPRDIQTALSACADLTGTLRTVLKSLNDGSLDNAVTLRDFAGPPDPFKSGHSWTQGFKDLGTQMTNNINAHIAAVEGIAETFHAAAIAFARVETHNEDDFKRISDGIPGVNMPKDASGPVPPRKLDNDLPSISHGSLVFSGDYTLPPGKTVRPETPKSLTWEQMYALGQNIFSTAAVSAASHWDWMKTELEKAFEDYKTKIHSTDNSWTGDSGVAARKMIDDYVESNKQLTDKAGEIAKKLRLTASWLKRTHEGMPQVPQPPFRDQTSDGKYFLMDWDNGYGHQRSQGLSSKKDQALESALKTFQDWFTQFYVAGLIDYNNSLASLSLPAPNVQVGAPKPQIPAPDDKGNGNPDDSKKAPAGTPVTTPGSPGSPSTPTDVKPTDPKDTDPKDTDPKDANPKDANPKANNPTTTTDTTLSTVTSALTTLAQTGSQLVESLASQASTLVQSLASQTTQKTTDTTKQLEQQLASLLNTPTVPTDPASPGGSPSSPGGSPTGTSPNGTPAKDNPQTRLFPRSNVTATDEQKSDTVTASRAGLATGTSTGTGTSSGSGVGGTPMGSAGAAGQGGGKEHKRPEYLRSGENLETVFEGIPEAVRPVAEK